MLPYAVTANVVADGLALMIGLGGRLGVLCSGAVIDAGLSGIAIAFAVDAVGCIHTRKPRVVIIPGALASRERAAIADACAAIDAELIELPAIVEMRDISHAIAKAVAVSQRRRQRETTRAM